MFWRIIDALCWRDRPVALQHLVDPIEVDPDLHEEEYKQRVRRRILEGLTAQDLPPLIKIDPEDSIRFFIVKVA